MKLLQIVVFGKVKYGAMKTLTCIRYARDRKLNGDLVRNTFGTDPHGDTVLVTQNKVGTFNMGDYKPLEKYLLIYEAPRNWRDQPMGTPKHPAKVKA